MGGKSWGRMPTAARTPKFRSQLRCRALLNVSRRCSRSTDQMGSSELSINAKRLAFACMGILAPFWTAEVLDPPLRIVCADFRIPQTLHAAGQTFTDRKSV